MNREKFLAETAEAYRPRWVALMKKYGDETVMAAWDAAEAAEQGYERRTHGDVINNARADAFNRAIGDPEFDYRYF